MESQGGLEALQKSFLGTKRIVLYPRGSAAPSAWTQSSPGCYQEANKFLEGHCSQLKQLEDVTLLWLRERCHLPHIHGGTDLPSRSPAPGLAEEEIS